MSDKANDTPAVETAPKWEEPEVVVIEAEQFYPAWNRCGSSSNWSVHGCAGSLIEIDP